MTSGAVTTRAAYTSLTPAAAVFSDERPPHTGAASLDIDDRSLEYIAHTSLDTTLQPLREFIRANAGLLLIILSQAFFAFMNVSVKFLNTLEPPVPPLELILIRMTITYVCCITYMYCAGISDPILGPKGVRKLLVLRGFTGFFGLSGMYCSLQYLSLSTATVLTFLVPFATAIAGSLLLHEPLAIREISAGALSLVGVLLIARPPFLFGSAAIEDDDGVTPAQRMLGVGISLIGVVGATGAYVTIRAIGKRAFAMHSIASFSLQCVLFSIPLSPLMEQRYVLPTNPTFLLLLPAIGISGFLAQTLLTMGLQRETAGRGSVGLYTQVFFAVMLEWIVFGHLPRGLSVIGMTIVIGCAGYVAIGKMRGDMERNKGVPQTNKDAELEEGLLDRFSVDTEDFDVRKDITLEHRSFQHQNRSSPVEIR